MQNSDGSIQVLTHRYATTLYEATSEEEAREFNDIGRLVHHAMSTDNDDTVSVVYEGMYCLPIIPSLCILSYYNASSMYA